MHLSNEHTVKCSFLLSSPFTDKVKVPLPIKEPLSLLRSPSTDKVEEPLPFNVFSEPSLASMVKNTPPFSIIDKLLLTLPTHFKKTQQPFIEINRDELPLTANDKTMRRIAGLEPLNTIIPKRLPPLYVDIDREPLPFRVIEPQPTSPKFA